jgi:hypothetical protein
MDVWRVGALSKIDNDMWGVTRGGTLLLMVRHYCHIPNNYCKILDLYVACCRLKMIMQTCSCLLSAQITSKTTYAQTHLDLRKRHIVKRLKSGRDRWRFVFETWCD